MKTSSTWSFRSIAGKIIMGLVLAIMIGSIGMAPAFSKDNDHDRGRYEKRGHAYAYGHDRRDYRPYGYGERRVYYPPPPVIYAPPRPPGIGIFFPPVYIHP
jgi:hypothetical protein